MDRAKFYRFLRKRHRYFIQIFMLLFMRNDESNGGIVAKNTGQRGKFGAKKRRKNKEYVAMIEKKVYTTPRNRYWAKILDEEKSEVEHDI